MASKKRFENELINHNTIQTFIKQRFWIQGPKRNRDKTKPVIKSELSVYSTEGVPTKPSRPNSAENSPINSPERKEINQLMR